MPGLSGTDVTTADLEPQFRSLFERCRRETMTTLERGYALWQAARYVVRNRIPGDVVECGVWRGGSMMLAALTLMAEGDTERNLWLYDTFEGMPPPEALDLETVSGRHATELLAEQPADERNPYWGIAPEEVVRRNMGATGYPPGRVRLVRGRVEDTLPAQAPDAIALLRLDTDWYRSTAHELETLWPRLVHGGVLIIDDYGYWAGCRKAVDEFFAGREDAPLLVRVDMTGRVAVKR